MSAVFGATIVLVHRADFNIQSVKDEFSPPSDLAADAQYRVIFVTKETRGATDLISPNTTPLQPGRPRP
jgi:hypothetical protein